MQQSALRFERDAFDVPVPVAKGSVASRQAAERLIARRLQGRKLAQMLEAYEAEAPRTLIAFEVHTRTGILICSISSLRNAAVKEGWLVAVGQRPGPYGVSQTSHRITDAGRRELDEWRTRHCAPPAPKRTPPTPEGAV